MDRFCASCGSPIPEDASSCPNCDTPVGVLARAVKPNRWAWIAALTAFVLLASAAGAYALLSGGSNGILFQDANSIGPDPFMKMSAFATAEPQSDDLDLPEPSKSPGLYGGSGDIGVCDPEAIITFLQENPDKRKAWAGVLGVPEDDIATYIRTLRPVTLTQDTRVTNHGFKNGEAYGFQAILEKGTAVLVDPDGNIVVKCFCGNPLLPPDDTDGPCTGCPPNYSPPPGCDGEECFETPTPEETPTPTPECGGAANPCDGETPDPTATPDRTPIPTTLKTSEPQPTTAVVAPASPAPTAVPTTPAPTPCDPATSPGGCTRP